MTIKSRIIEKIKIGLIHIILFLVLGMYSCAVHAQTLKPIKYMGFEAAFGGRSFLVRSNIPAINKMQAGHEGGTLGIVFGNDILKARIKAAGIYYSNANTPRTQQIFETGATLNFYPLQLNNKDVRFRPYIAGGVSVDNIKFFGTYLPDQNNESAYEPMLGKVSQINATCGIGLEYQLPVNLDFIHLFAEAVAGLPVQSIASSKVFSQTTIRQFTAVSFGVSFGRHR